MADYWHQVVTLNNWQKDRISKLIVNSLFGTVAEKKLAVLGFAFKANTNDTRNSACIKICKDLIEEGAFLSIYDPKVDKDQIERDLSISNAEQSLDNGNFIRVESIESAIDGSYAVIILTEWEEFKQAKWDLLFKKMKRPAWIFDTRSMIDVRMAEEIGFNVWQIGNSSRYYS